MGEWLKHFELGKTLYIVDGANFVAKPWEEMEKIQDFLGISREFTRETFVESYHKKGYFCLKVNHQKILQKM